MSRAIGNMSGAATVTKKASSASRILLIAANASRQGFAIRNSSTAVLTVFLGAQAGTEEGSVTIAPTASGVDGYWECPINYTGDVSVQSAAANGSVYGTEYL